MDAVSYSCTMTTFFVIPGLTGWSRLGRRKTELFAYTVNNMCSRMLVKCFPRKRKLLIAVMAGSRRIVVCRSRHSLQGYHNRFRITASWLMRNWLKLSVTVRRRWWAIQWMRTLASAWDKLREIIVSFTSTNLYLATGLQNTPFYAPVA